VSGRAPLLYGLFAVIGVVAAVVFSMTLGSGGYPVAATGSPPTSLASGEPSPGGSATPSSSGEASAEPQPTAEPTAPPTPTPQPTKTPRPTPTPNTNPTIVSFEAPKTEDCTNASAGSITLAWEIVNATGVTLSIEGGGIYATYPGLSQTVEVPFGCEQNDLTKTYTLTTTGGVGPPATITKKVTAKAPRIKSFTLGPAECQSTSGSVGIAMSFEIVAATGAQLKIVGGQVYANYNTKATDDIIQFDCSKPSQTFRLTTTGGFGEEDTMKILVDNPLL
jgi:hypothetical protein